MVFVRLILQQIRVYFGLESTESSLEIRLTLFDPTNPGKTYIEEYVTFMQQKFDLLGATGKAVEFNQ